MDNYAQKVGAIGMESHATALSTQDKVAVAKHTTSLIMSAVSEPEGGLIRHFFIEANETGFIVNLIVKDSNGDKFIYNLDKLLASEVTIARVKGLDAVMMQIVTATGEESLVRVRYLSRAPSQYSSFELRARKLADGHWAMFERDRPRMFKWILFRSKIFMGVTIGVDSFELSQEQPRI